MKIVTLLYFASVREALDRSAETVELPADVDDIGTLCSHLGARGAPWTLLGADRGWRFAVNREMADGAEAPVGDGDEVAVFPPVTGG